MNDLQTESAVGIQPGIITHTSNPATGLSGEIRMVALADLRESPWNPRQYYPEAAMAELTESMRASGFRAWLPIVARPIGGGSIENGLFEIAAGHRRSRAARAAGIEFVPCIVREMSDVEFLDVLNFDNCGREDVHPLHEAAGWQAWMEKTGHGVNDIAARIGQSKEYVYQRLKYSALIDEAAKAFFDGKITAGHAILIARLQPSDQKKALKFCEPRGNDYRPGVRDLAGYIQRDVHLNIEAATFDLESTDLVPSAGSCVSCPKRTKNAPELALDRVAGEVYDSDEDASDECTDPGCFSSKLNAHIVRLKDILQTSGREVVEVSGGYGKAKKGLLSRNDYSEVSETAPGAKAAIVMDGLRAGEVVHVKLNASAKGSDPAAAKAAEERAQAKKREAALRERTVRLKVLEAIGAKVTATSFTRHDLEGFVVGRFSSNNSLNLCRLHGIDVKDSPDTHRDWQAEEAARKKLVSAVPKMSDVEFFRLAFEVTVAEDLDHWAIERNNPPSAIFALARRFKVDAVKIRTEVEDSSKAAEGGTRREVEKPDSPAKATSAKKADAPAKKANSKTPAKTAPAKKPAPKKKAAPAKKK
jgi:ParB family chromosome partitioning protein